MAPKKAVLPRLKHVAEEADVSLTAASRILRGQGEKYALETRNRVMDAAKKLGWRRNQLVNAMQKGQSKSIGVMIPPFDSFWVEVLYAIHEVVTEAGYMPITVWPSGANRPGEFERQKAEGFELINELLDRRVDGLLLWPAYAVAFSEHFPELANRIVPMGAIEHVFPSELAADRVESDDQSGVSMLVEHLVGLGHTRLACLSTREITAQTWAVRRREYFEQAAEAQPGVTYKSWRLNEDGDNGLQVARDLLTSPFKPTAVFGVSDHEARLIYQAADELAVRVPDDLSVVGFGNLDFAATMSPGLTTLDRKPGVMGRLLGELLLARLSHPEQKASTVQVDVEMITRGSTGPAAD